MKCKNNQEYLLMEELLSQAADRLGSLLPFLNDPTVVGILLSIVSLILSALLCFWGYRLFSCFAAGSGFVIGACLGFLLSRHFTDESAIILFVTLFFGFVLAALASRLITLSSFLVTAIITSLFVCGLLVSLFASLSNTFAGILGLIAGVIAGIICVKLQKPVIILVTAFGGALGIVQILFKLISFEQISIFYGAFLFLAVIGTVLQFINTRHEKS